MGIKDLWPILTPFCERKPMYELQGKRVAVDLSCWICEAQNVSDYSVQPRMYLRNLYFRTCYLLLLDVEPVFVLEGKAPKLKYDTIAARNAIQFKGAKPKKDSVQTGKDRTRFNFVLKQCEQMLNLMGLACIKGNGEAESLCAYLNEDGLVQGCISQDSDCFAYGAKVVYRNFSISTQGAHTASGGSVDVYDITKAYQTLKFGRNKIVALALLCGSDYSDGVFGVGKDSALKLFEKMTDEETLDRLRSWRQKKSLYEEFERKLADKNICTSCGHSGKLQSHNRIGCSQCQTTKGCDFSKFKNERLAIKNELNIRNKALQDPNFPNEDLIKEFLTRKDNVQKLDLTWKQPDLVSFVKFTSKFLQWEELYAFEKFLPILTRWQLLKHESLNETVNKISKNVKGILFPERIKKVRNPKGVPSYEIIWSDKNDHFKGLIPEEQLANTESEKLWSTIEPQNLVAKPYPDLVEAFVESKRKPQKGRKRQTKNKDNIEDLSELLKNTSISEPKVKKPRQPRNRKKIQTDNDKVDDLEDSFSKLKIKGGKMKTIDSYFKKAVKNCQTRRQDECNKDDNVKAEVQISTKQEMNKLEKELQDNSLVLNEGDMISCSTPCKPASTEPLPHSFPFDETMSDFDDEEDSDLVDIIDNIVSRKRHSLIDANLQKLGLKLYREEDDSKCDNRCSFFISAPVENDLFEATFNNKDVEMDSQDSLLGDELNVEESEEQVENTPENDCDSFSVNTVPLINRIRKL